jgi:hypothetical protein
MGRLAAELAEQAKSIVKLQRDLDHAIIETAITLVLTCIGASAHGGDAVKGVGAAAKHIFVDAVVERAASEVLHH